MNISQECVACIINQSFKVAEAIKADEVLKHKLTSRVQERSKSFSFSDTPPAIAAYVYEEMAEIANKDDLYDKVKESSTIKARSLVPHLEEKLHSEADKFLTATKIAVAGNVIDLASAIAFDLDEEFEKVFHTEFTNKDYEKLYEKLLDAKRVLIIGDNVGEHVFDYMYIKVLKELFSDITFYYMVRGNPIINDVTLKEAKEQGFEAICEVVDSGVNTPGFTYDRANEYSKKLFNEVDLIISKGMGNYECISPASRENICYLLKIKCSVVARSLDGEIGDIVCKLI